MYTAILRYTTFLYKDRVYYIYTQDTQAKLTKARTPLEFVNIINHLCFFFFIKKTKKFCLQNSVYIMIYTLIGMCVSVFKNVIYKKRLTTSQNAVQPRSLKLFVMFYLWIYNVNKVCKHLSFQVYIVKLRVMW